MYTYSNGIHHTLTPMYHKCRPVYNDIITYMMEPFIRYHGISGKLRYCVILTLYGYMDVINGYIDIINGYMDVIMDAL